MITSALSFLITIGGAIGAFVAKIWWISLIPLGILIIFIAPYKLWKVERGRVEKFKNDLKPKISVSIEHEPFPTGDYPIEKKGYFWVLKVINIGKTTVNRCYAEIVHFYGIGDNEQRTSPLGMPKEGHRLPCSKQTGGGAYEISLGSDEPAYLDYIMIPNDKSGLLYVPSYPNTPNGRPNYTSFPIGLDKLDIKIAVASREGTMERSTINFVFEWKGGEKAIITELENTSPQVPDKEGYQT